MVNGDATPKEVDAGAEWVQRLHVEAARLGFVACGIAPAAPDALRVERLEQWLGEGRHGQM